MIVDTLEIRCVDRRDWSVIRGLRLRALLDAPDAFGSEFVDEAPRSPAEWQRVLDRSTWMVAFRGPEAIGLLRIVAATDDRYRRHLESIWIDPRYRRRGVARRLIAETAARERTAGVTELLIWVLDGNPGARRAYQRIGFVPTGERQVMAGTTLRESRFRLSLSAA